jgi:hypothetical protein
LPQFHFLFFLGFTTFLDLALLAGFLEAVLVLPLLFFPPLTLPNAFSQLAQKAGVVPVRTMGPPMKSAPVSSSIVADVSKMSGLVPILPSETGSCQVARRLHLQAGADYSLMELEPA